MTVIQKSMMFWVAMCSQVEIYCHFIEKYSPCLENRSENIGNIYHQNICKCLPYYTTSHHRMLQTLPNHTMSIYKTVRPGKFSIQTKLHIPTILNSHSGARKTAVLWHVMLRTLVEGYQGWKEKYCLHFLHRCEDVNMFLQNASNHITIL
jgi:hypothetical protein